MERKMLAQIAPNKLYSKITDDKSKKRAEIGIN